MKRNKEIKFAIKMSQAYQGKNQNSQENKPHLPNCKKKKGGEGNTPHTP